MSNNGTGSSAAFEEVLSLGVDTTAFADQMNQVVDIYTAAIAKMPEMDKVGGVSFSASIAKLNEAIEKMSKGVGEALGDVGAHMVDTADVIETQMSKASKAVEESQAKIVDALENVQNAQRKTRESTGILGDFFTGFTDNIVKSAGSLMKTLIIYDTLNAVIGAFTTVITAPFKAVAEGFKYLQDVQERGSEVKAALLQSVSYSKDWGENVKIAGDQADRLVHKIDDIAAKLHVASQTVQTGFTTFLEAGGRHLTNNVDEALQVSGIAVGALQSQNPTIQTRALRSEMQGLAHGSLADTSKLATALGLSRKEMQEMVVHASKYHDLLQQIVQKAPGITDRIADANDRQSALISTLELYGKRWAALVADPLFKEFTNILKEILEWVNKNGDKLTAVGQDLGKMMADLLVNVKDLVKTNWDNLVTSFQSIAKFAVTIGATMSQMVLDAVSLIALAAKAKQETTAGRDLHAARRTASEHEAGQYAGLIGSGIAHAFSPNRMSGTDANQRANAIDKEADDARYNADRDYDKKIGGVSLTDILKKWNDGVGSIDATMKKAWDSIDNLGKGGGKPGSEAAAAIDTPNDNLNLTGNKENDLKEYQQTLRGEVIKTKNAFNEERDAVQDALASNNMNHKEAADYLKNLYEQEIAQVEKITKMYQTKFKASGAKDPQIAAALKSSQNELEQLKGEVQQKIDAAKKAASAEEVAVQKAHLDGMFQMEEQHQRQHLASVKASEAAGNLTRAEAFDAETAILEKDAQSQREYLQKEVDNTHEGTVEHEEAAKKLMLFDDQHTANARLRTEERITLLRQEMEALYQYKQALLQTDIDRQSLIANESDLSPGARASSTRRLLGLQLNQSQGSIERTAGLLGDAQRRNPDSVESQRLAEELAKLQNQHLTQFGQTITQGAASAGSNTGLAQVFAKETAQQGIDAAQTKLDALNNSGQGNSPEAQALTQTIANMQKVADSLGLSLTKVKESLESTLLGSDFQANWDKSKQAWDDATDASEKMTAGFSEAADGLSGLTNLGKSITGTINQYEKGRKEGGVIGGVGSLLSSGPVSDALSMVPVVGSIVKPLGEAFSFIGDMFVAQARKIAEQINKEIDAINTDYSEQKINISQAITELKQEEQSAISQLSGVKGGQDQLNKLLPQLDQEIASLQQQADNTKKSFEDTVLQLQSGNTELQQWVQTWQGINKQVADYLASGGSVEVANQFLNEQLQAQLKTMNDNLDQGEQTAIQDAISLNNLLQQRVDLVKQEQQAEFGIMNANAMEKRESYGVQVQSQLAQQRQGYNEQLEALDYQIQTATQKVTLEKQVFDIATDTANLQAQSNALTIQSLNEQLDTYKMMQQIVAGTSGLAFSGSGFAPVIPGTNISGASAISGTPAVNVTINIDAQGQDVNSSQFANHLASAIQAQATANRTSI